MIFLCIFELFLSGQVQMLSIYSANFHIYILKAIANRIRKWNRYDEYRQPRVDKSRPTP